MLVAAQALLFGRLVGTDTDYDEGVYLASVDALEHGQRLGEDVFAPQPPGWYLLLRLLSLAGADSVRGFQTGMVVVAVAICFVAYLVGRSLAGSVAGLTSSALPAIAPPFPLFAHRVLADIPPVGIGLLSLWFALQARERRSLALAAVGGATLALAVTVKPTGVLAAPAFLLLLLWERSDRARAAAAAMAGATLVAAVFAVAYRDVLGELWQSVVVYHRQARDTPAVVDKTQAFVSFLNWRTPFAWLLVLGLLASVALLRRRQLGAVWALWLWAAIAIAFLLNYHPLHDNHLLILPIVLAVPAGTAVGALAARVRRPAVAIGALALVLAAGYVQQQRRVALGDLPEERNLVAAAEFLSRETAPEDLVVSDHSIVPFLADRRAAGPLVDTARLRFQTGSLTDAAVLRELEAYDVQAVVAGRAFAERPTLLRLLERRYGPPRSSDGELFVFLGR